jgi:hypothetical protein
MGHLEAKRVAFAFKWHSIACCNQRRRRPWTRTTEWQVDDITEYHKENIEGMLSYERVLHRVSVTTAQRSTTQPCRCIAFTIFSPPFICYFIDRTCVQIRASTYQPLKPDRTRSSRDLF